MATLLETAHDAGLEVHAWMNVNTMWQADPPVAAEHVFNTHGPESTDPWVSVRSDGVVAPAGNYYFDLGHPDAADYLVRTACSLIDAYDVDGLSLDFIRYPDHNPNNGVNEWGYNEVTLERFRAATGREEVPEPTDEEWARWRRMQVTNLVRRLYLEVYALDPTVRVSASTIAREGSPQRVGGWKASAPYQTVLQDWRAWLREGVLDTNIVMNYKADADDRERADFREWVTFAADNQYDRHCVIGTGLYRNSVGASVSQIEAALSPTEDGNSPVGWAGFSYATPSRSVEKGEQAAPVARGELITALTEGTDRTAPPFETDAAMPSMPWKTNPTTGHLVGTIESGAGEYIDACPVAVTNGDEAVAVTETDGNGWFGVVDLSPGAYRVIVRASADGDVDRRVTVSAGKPTEVHLRLDTASP